MNDTIMAKDDNKPALINYTLCSTAQRQNLVTLAFFSTILFQQETILLDKESPWRLG